jgi:ribosomal protein S18 acetylase RimI-like enzyme
MMMRESASGEEPNTSVRIAPATAGDAELVRRIMQEAFAEYVGVLQPPSGAHTETVEDVLRVMALGGAVLAWLGDEAVGAARYERRGGHLYVGRVAVLPAYRKQGIATALMRHLEDVARDLGLPAIQVGVRMSLPSNLALYQRLGYELIDVQPHPRGPDRVGTLVKMLRDRVLAHDSPVPPP